MADIVAQVTEGLRDYCYKVTNDMAILNSIFRKYMEAGEIYKTHYANNLSGQALDIIHRSSINNLEFYYIMSFLLQATNCKAVYMELLQYIIGDEAITKDTKYFLYRQLVSYNFMNSFVMDEERWDIHDDLYSHIYSSYLEEFHHELGYIPKEERNQNFVMVFTCQVLGIGHGPTKTLLDRCYVLEKRLNKKVYIVNTAELLSGYGGVPWFDGKVANYNEEYSQVAYLEYKGIKFPFFQCPREMPQVPIVRGIVDMVKNVKPYFIVTIGGDSIVSDLCSNIVPTITIPTVSVRAETRGQFQASYNMGVKEEDKRWLRKHGFSQEHIIESFFTFSFVEQTHHYTRKELGLPEDKFVVLVVGYRLDEEISSGFTGVLNHLADNGMYIAFMGKFEQYERYADKNPALKSNSVFLGNQADPLAVCECCDLYLNPERRGGGTSAVEAMFKGLPVVTLDFGDVAACVGTDFPVRDWVEMQNQVIKYSENKEYYDAMSNKARERADRLTDSEAEFVRVIKKMEESQYFN